MPAWPPVLFPPFLFCFVVWDQYRKIGLCSSGLLHSWSLINVSSMVLQTFPLQIESLTWTCQSNMIKNHLQRSNNFPIGSLSSRPTRPFPLGMVTLPRLRHFLVLASPFLWPPDRKRGSWGICPVNHGPRFNSGLCHCDVLLFWGEGDIN